MILLDVDERLPGVAVEKSPEIGTLLKVDTEPSIALALVSAMSSPMPSHGQDEPELRIVEVEFIGELPKNEHGEPTSFRRGISTYPALGDLVFRASKNELSMAYACDKAASIRIGRIQQDACDTGDGQNRRAAWQTLRRSRHDWNRQILRGGADPEPHSREKSRRRTYSCSMSIASMRRLSEVPPRSSRPTT